jgi:hypothetical protein
VLSLIVRRLDIVDDNIRVIASSRAADRVLEERELKVAAADASRHLKRTCRCLLTRASVMKSLAYIARFCGSALACEIHAQVRDKFT